MTLSTYICLCGFLACLAALAAMKARHICRDVWRSFTGRRGAFAALAAFAVIATICAQKPGPTPVITVDSFLADAGSYATNDVLHVAVTNAPAYAGIDFSSCPVLVYARPRGLSDAPEWEELLPRRTFSELPADYAIEDATNYNYLVYLDYVPPSPVHTNGVFELRGFVVPGDEPGNLEQLAAGFINSRAITIRDLPYDAEVEYLKSDGAQYINTGIGKPSIGTITYWEAEAGFDSSYSATRKFTAGYEYPNMMYYCEFNNSQFGGVGWNVRYFCNATLETRKLYKVSMSLNGGTATYSVVVGDDTITKTASPASQQDIAIDGKFMLFCMSRQYNGPGVMIGKNKLWVNGVLVGDYIPVRKDGVGYMYDCISHKLLGNAGTGSFGYGNDK